MAANFDPYHRWLGIGPDEQPPNYYRLLGVRMFEAVPEVIENAADQRMAHLRSLSSGPNAAHAQRLLNEISNARVCLLTPEKKKQYDRQLQAAGGGAAAGQKAATASAATSPLPTAKPLPAKPLPAKPQPAAVNPPGAPPQVPVGNPPNVPMGLPVQAGTSVSSVRRRPPAKSQFPILLLVSGGVLAVVLVVGGLTALFALSGSGSEESDDIGPVVQTDGDGNPTDGTPDGGHVVIPKVEKVTQDVSPLRITLRGNSPPPAKESAQNFATLRQIRPGSWTQATPEGVSVDVAGQVPPVLPLPFQAMGSYALELTAAAPSQYAGLAFEIAVAGRPCRLVVDQPNQGGFYTGFAPADAATLQNNKHLTRYLPPEEEVQVECTVQENEVKVTCNGISVFQWSGDPHALPTPSDPPVGYQLEREASSEPIVCPLTLKTVRVWRLERSMPPPSPDGSIDLIAAIDSSRDVARGRASVVDGKLKVIGDRPTIVKLPAQLPNEYVLDVRLTRSRTMNCAVTFGLVVGDRLSWVMVDSQTNDWQPASGLGLVDGRHPNRETNATSVVGKYLLPDDKPANLLLLVQGQRPEGKCRVTAGIDGVKFLDFLDDAKRLGPLPPWVDYLRGEKGLSVGCWEGAVEFERIVLRPASAAPSWLLDAKPSQPLVDTEPAKPEKPVLAAVPDAAALDAARKQVADAFGGQRAAAETRQQKLDLVKQLIETSKAETDPAKQYALLDEGQSIAMEIEDPALALETVEVRSARFEVDAWKQQTNVLGPILKSKSDLRRGLAVGASLEVIDDALRDRQFETAGKLAEDVQAAAAAGKLFAIRKHMAGLLQRIDAGRQGEAAANAARETLASTPDDPAANGVLGRWLCLNDGNWEEGLPLLAKSDDPAFRTPAEKELALAADASADAQVEVAGGWWSLADQQSDAALKAAIRSHAATWYRTALPKVGSVLTKTTIEGRLKEVEDAAASPQGAGGDVAPFTPWLIRDALLLYTFEPTTLNRGADGRFYYVDQSGHGINGVIEGSQQARGSKGKAGVCTFFDGRDDDIICTGLRSKMVGLKQFTLAAWILPGKTEGAAFIFDVGEHANRSTGLHFKGAELVFNLADGYGGLNLDVPAAGASGAWHHVAAVWDGREQRLYVDGRLQAHEACTITELNETTLGADEARIGGQAKSFFRGGRYFAGAMDEFVLLPRAFSDRQVQQLYRAGEAETVLPALVEKK